MSYFDCTTWWSHYPPALLIYLRASVGSADRAQHAKDVVVQRIEGIA